MFVELTFIQPQTIGDPTTDFLKMQSIRFNNAAHIDLAFLTEGMKGIVSFIKNNNHIRYRFPFQLLCI